MNLKPLLIVPPLAIGVLGYLWLTQPQEGVTGSPDVTPQAVRALTATLAPLTVTATGYGRVEPVRTWSAVSQVEGRVISTAPGLALGSVVEADALLVQIDPTNYELAVAKAEANLASAEASLVELAQQEENSRVSLEIEQRVYEVAQSEFARAERLANSGTTSTATLDTAQKSLLAQETSLAALNNTVALYPAQRASMEATLAVRQAELVEARRNLEDTTIRAPYRGRVSLDAVEEGQFIRAGTELVTLEGIAQAEVSGAFQPQSFVSVAIAALGPSVATVTEVDTTQVIDLLEQADVQVSVQIDYAQDLAVYPAQLERFRGTLDEETGTIGIAVRVDDPLVARAQEDRPPLEFKTFASVVMETTTPQPVIAIPRGALRQDGGGATYVYLADAEDTLARAAVTPVLVTGDLVVIGSGLNDGDRVLLSSPRPAIVGMPLLVEAE